MSRKKKRKFKAYIKVLLVLLCVLGFVSVYFVFGSSDSNLDDDIVIDNDNSVSDIEEDILDIDSDDYMAILEYKAKYDYRYDEVVANRDIYPEKLLEMLSRNDDMIGYMYDYDEKEGHIYIDNIGNVTKGEYPLLLQYDKKWGYGIYGDRVLAINGCGPTALAMALAGLTGNNDVTPYDIAKYAYDNGYYTSQWGTKWDLMTIGIKEFGIVGKSFVLTKDNLFNELNSGHPVIASMRPGDFTTVGHFILLTGVVDGKIRVNDSNSVSRSNELWEYDVIAPQIKGQWSFSLTV